MSNIYEEFKNTQEWEIISKAIDDLISNQDLELTADKDYIVGYITKHLVNRYK